MATKKTKAPAPIKAYDLLAMPTKQVASRKVVIDGANKVFVLPSSESPVPPEIMVATLWSNMDDFLKITRSTAEAYHETYIGERADKRISDDEVKMWVWAWFVKNGSPLMPDRTVEGEKERKSTIGDSQYSRGECADASPITTAQAKACWILFDRCIDKRASVTEKELRAFVEANAAELKTKQDPWRIFQYYRPKLIGAKLIRRS